MASCPDAAGIGRHRNAIAYGVTEAVAADVVSAQSSGTRPLLRDPADEVQVPVTTKPRVQLRFHRADLGGRQQLNGEARAELEK
jgi:hypothetical protein